METELREKIVVDGAEQAASKLGMLAQAAGRVAHGFQGIFEIAGALGGVAGAFKIVETIRETDQLFQAIGRVKDMTEISAARAHTIFDMFELSGIEMGSAERIMTSLTRQAGRMGESMSGTAGQSERLQGIMKKLGVAVKSGPEDRLLAMAKAAQAGKIQINDLVTSFAIPRSQAAQMMTMLKQGPEHLKAIQQDTLNGADLIDDRALESYRTMIQVRRELSDAWGGIVGVLYKNLLPAVTLVLQEMKKGFDSIMPVATAIGKGLADHMELVVRLTKTYLTLLAASKVANLATGSQMGIAARGKQLWGLGMGAMTNRVAKFGAMDYFAAKEASPGAGMFQMAGGPLMRVFGSLAGRLSIIGAVIGVVIVAFELLKRNTLGIRDAFVKTFGGIISTMGGVIGKVVAVLEKLWEALKPIIAIFAGALLIGLLIIAKALEVVADILDAVMTGLIALMNGLIWIINKIPGVSVDFIDMDAKKKAADTAKSGAPGSGEGAASNYQDFRGSKFEIENNFPQGIDGGRVAVAFGDELAKLGERRLDSGVRPLFSYR